MEECKRLHFRAKWVAFRIPASLAAAALALLAFWVVSSCSKGPDPSPPKANTDDRFVGTWEVTDPGTRARDGVSFLMISPDAAQNGGYIVSSEHNRQVFQEREGRLIHDTVTILYNEAHDSISHSSLGELKRKTDQ